MRVRIRFTKVGKVRFTSHRDLARVLERAARRAGLPLTYTQGFSPRPRLSFGLALPTGCESTGEYAEIELDEPVDLDDLPGRLSAELPPGVEVVAAVEAPRGAPSLQEVVDRCRWSVELPDVIPVDAQRAVDALLARDEVVVRRERKGRTVDQDLRPGILEITVAPHPAGGTTLDVVLAVHPRSVRPSDLLEALDASWEPRVVRREHQLIATEEGWREPLPAPDVAAHAEARAS